MFAKNNGTTNKKKAGAIALLLSLGLAFSPAMLRAADAEEVPGGEDIAPVTEEQAPAPEILTEANCSLLVLPGSDKEMDVNNASVVYDLYKVADLTKDPMYDTYHFVVDGASPYAALAEDLADEANLDSNKYKELAQEAAKTALLVNPQTPVAAAQPVTPAGTSLDSDEGAVRTEGLTPGLYLLIAHGSDMTLPAEYTEITEDEKEELSTVARSETYKYNYLPELVCLPNTHEIVEPGQVIMTSDGSWKNDIAVTLKPSMELRWGDLTITKDLDVYELKDPATFVFEITAKLDGKVVYNDVVSIKFSTSGVQSRTIVGKIPVTSEVTVTEIYSGANYVLVSDPTKTIPTFVLSNTVDFENTYDDKYHGGGSIENRFAYDNGGWVWTPVSDTAEQ